MASKTISDFYHKHRQELLYGVSLALLLFVLRWLELRFLILDHIIEIYVGAIALMFTGLGIWLAHKLTMPKVETRIVEREVFVTAGDEFTVNEPERLRLGISQRELEVLQLVAEGLSNQQIAERFICGLISGALVSTFMVASMAVCYQKQEFEGNMLLGYAAMLLSFSMVFVGIKNYRDKYSGGSVSFGKAFKIGLYITLVASTVYVIVWLIDYYLFIPDFMDKYTEHLLKQFQAEGPTAVELEAKVTELAGYKEMYQSPLMVILWTYAEILPVGLVVTLISALILKKPGTEARPV